MGLNLDMRFNIGCLKIEIKKKKDTDNTEALQKAVDFSNGFILGFNVQDVLAMLLLDDIYIESFEIKDFRRLNKNHRSRTIGRLAGSMGKTKFAIENATKTRILLTESKIHVLGSFENIRFARDQIGRIILGSPASKSTGHNSINKNVLNSSVPLA